MPNARRAVMLGLDAMVVPMVEKFIAEGVLPNLARLAERGCLTRLRPVIPAQTPTNWTTLATGATPGTHGVALWGSHVPGEPAWEFHQSEAFNAGLCRAEYLWEAAARQDHRSVVFNYAGYPPTTESAVFIDWLFQPARSYYDLAPPTVYHTDPELSAPDLVELCPAVGWANLPVSNLPLLETELPIATATEGSGPTYQLLVIARGDAYDTVFITEAKDATKPLAVLSAGEWSEWLSGPFETADQGKVEGAVRFKLLELSPDGLHLRLYRSDAFPTDGRLCSDRELGRRLIEEFGPYVHSGMTCHLHCHGTLDWETCDEVMAAEAKWWSGAVQYAMQATNASLLVLHWHILDSMGHTFVCRVDPTGTEYDPNHLQENWEVIRGYYRAADRLVGAFLERLDDGQTVFAVVSDHGMPANRKAVSLVNLLKEHGWITLTNDGQNVDWPHSRVFFSQNHLWINLQGRDAGGIVPPEEYASLRSAILATLRDIKDPDTGEHALAFVLPREDAPMVGLWGEHIGDIVFCYSGGFRWSGPEVLRMGEERVVFPCSGGNHGPMIPTYETDVASVMAGLVLAGPGVKPGVAIPKIEQARMCTTDLAPTLAYLLGLEPPAQTEGRVLKEMLSGFSTERPPRTLTPTARPLRPPAPVRPRRVALQGDVTDEQ